MVNRTKSEKTELNSENYPFIVTDGRRPDRDVRYENRTLSEKTELNSENYPKISIVTDGLTYTLDSIVSTTSQKPVDTKTGEFVGNKAGDKIIQSLY